MKRTICLNLSILPSCENRKNNRCYYDGECFLKEVIDNKSDIELQSDEVEQIGFENLKVKEPQVDFEMLALLRCNMKHNDSVTLYREDIKNLQLFFKLLSTKPTFAAKAFRELNKLNK